MNAIYFTKGLSLLFSLVGLVVASQATMASSDSGTLTAGTTTVPCPPNFLNHITFTGFDGGFYGSYSPTGLTGGNTITWVNDQNTFCQGGSGQSSLFVSGFSSNPGSTWLTSITCDGVTNSAASASVYQYVSGSAQWFWSRKFGLVNGSMYSCTIVHN